jgi:hypothetical protein
MDFIHTQRQLERRKKTDHLFLQQALTKERDTLRITHRLCRRCQQENRTAIPEEKVGSSPFLSFFPFFPMTLFSASGFL